MTFCRQLAALITHSVSCATIRRKSLHFTYIPLTLLYGMYWCTSFRLHWIIQHLDCCRLTFVMLLTKDLKKKWRYHFFWKYNNWHSANVCVAYLIQILKKIATWFFAFKAQISLQYTYIFRFQLHIYTYHQNLNWKS